jgi:hypothetical protein
MDDMTRRRKLVMREMDEGNQAGVWQMSLKPEAFRLKLEAFRL